MDAKQPSDFLSRWLNRNLNEPKRATVPIAPLRTVQTVDERDILDLLNMQAAPAANPGDLPRIAWGESAKLAVSTHLRPLVDEWIESGRASNGCEAPQTRTFERSTAAAFTAYQFSTRGKMHLIGRENALHLWFDVQDTSKGVTAGSPSRLAPNAASIAAEKLVLFLLSELRNKIAKCRNLDCGKYFVLKHWNRTYKAGTFCGACQRTRSLQSAVKATAEERNRAEIRLHEIAANRFRMQIVQNADWHKNAAMKERVSAYLTSRINRSLPLRKAYPSGVSGKWVARYSNWSAIEAAAKKEG